MQQQAQEQQLLGSQVKLENQEPVVKKTQNENSDVSIQGRLCFHMDE